MKLIDFRPFSRSTLRGFASIALTNGLIVTDCPVHVAANGRAWASLPAKPMLDRDGQPIVIDGKRQYDAILKWRDRDLADRWSAAVVELVRAAHPAALDAGGTP